MILVALVAARNRAQPSRPRSRSRAGQQIESPRTARHGSVFPERKNPTLRDRLFTRAPQADVTQRILGTVIDRRVACSHRFTGGPRDVQRVPRICTKLSARGPCVSRCR